LAPPPEPSYLFQLFFIATLDPPPDPSYLLMRSHPRLWRVSTPVNLLVPDAVSHICITCYQGQTLVTHWYDI